MVDCIPELDSRSGTKADDGQLIYMGTMGGAIVRSWTVFIIAPGGPKLGHCKHILPAIPSR